MVRISWRKFWRAKGSWYQIGMFGSCCLLLQWALWARRLIGADDIPRGDQLTALLLGAVNVMCWVIAIALLVNALVIVQLRLQDQRGYLGMLAALGYTDGQVTLLQMLELLIALVAAWGMALPISLLGEALMAKYLLAESELLLIIDSGLLLESHAQVLALLAAVYAASAGGGWLVIRRMSHGERTKQ